MTALPRIYLAGPDVFLPDAAGRAAALKSVCARHGLIGVVPLDALDGGDPPDWLALSPARRIALRNEAHVRGCAALLANLTPFRGPSADVGTVFEIGFMRALGRPVFAWSNDAQPFAARTLAGLGAAARRAPDGWRDGEGMLVEDFGDLADNLMIDSAVRASGGALFVAAVPAAARWSALDAFERAVAAIAALSPWREPA